ncbi:MAG: acyl-CoA dehydrogenase family protein, partial [Burkholderiaceae bacterium]
ATLLMLKLASAFDAPDDPLLRAWRRIVTPAAKFWICKRAIAFTGECMEVWGGNGYVETGPMARMYREAPVNSIWEGSGNVMCLDVLRALERDPEGALLLLADLRQAAAGHPALLALLEALQRDLQSAPEEREALARRFVQRLVLAAQASLMLRHAPQEIAEAFVASRLDADGGRVYGTMAAPALQQRVLDRAWPR